MVKFSEPISKAKTLLLYHSADPDLMSFRANEEAIVYMKSAGTYQDLWYVKIKEQSGFVPKKFLRESKIYEKNPQFVNPVEVRRKAPDTAAVLPDKVKEAHEVIEGTTIYSTETTNPDIKLTTETPNIVVESVTQQLNSNEDQVKESQKEQTVGIPVNNIDQNVSEESVVDTEIINNRLENLPDVAPSDLVAHEENNEAIHESLNLENKTQGNINESSKTVQEKLTLSSSENTEMPKNVESEQVQESNLPNPSEIYENSENQSKESKATESQIVPSNITPESQTEKIKEQTSETLPAQDSGSSSGVFSQDHQDPILVSDEQKNEVDNDDYSFTKENSETFYEENINEQINDIENDDNPNDPDTFEPVESEKLNEISAIDTLITEANENLEKINPKDTVNVETIENLNEVENDSTNSIENNITQSLPTPPETIPTLAPLVINPMPPDPTPDTIPPPNVPEIQPPTQKPPVYQPPINPTTETLPPIFQAPKDPLVHPLESTTPNTYSYSHETESNKEEYTTASYTESYTTDAPPLEDIYRPDIQSNSENTNGASNEEDSSEGILSSMYSTLADIWPSTTEAPPSLFNTEAYPTFEEEKIDGKASFSFMSYLMSMYYSVMGVDEDMKALFPSHGKLNICFEFLYII